MVDRKAKASKVSEDPKAVVELGEDERWQARLEEARARREVALREKASKTSKKQRRKPWEEEPGDDSDDFEIKPIIQEKPSDEKALDLADRLESVRAAKAEGPKVVPTPPPPPEPEPEPVPAPVEKAPLRRQPEFKSRSRSFDEIIPPGEVPTVAPAPMPKRKKRRNNDLVAEGAPDVIDLAQRYASTLKPPVNVTAPFDTVPREALTPSQAPRDALIPSMAMRYGRSRRPFGLGLIVLVFAMVPLAQVAPPLEKGPAQPASPFFALPPALGLTTSMVWPVRQTESGEWVPAPAPEPPAALPGFETAPLPGLGPQIGAAPAFGALPRGEEEGGLPWQAMARPDGGVPLGALGDAPVADDLIQPMEVPVPRPRPTAPDAGTATQGDQDEAPASIQPDDIPAITPETVPLPRPETIRDGNSNTVVDRLPDLSGDGALANVNPDARPHSGGGEAGHVPVASSPLRVTILVPARASSERAAQIASDTEARGHEVARVREVDVSISRPNVRYFHAEDRAEAVRLARAYGAEIKDFTWFRPAPELGTTEIWLSGSGNGSGGRPAPEARRLDDPAPEPLGRITVVRTKPTFLERLLTRAEDEIEIILPDPSAILDSVRTGGSGGN